MQEVFDIPVKRHVAERAIRKGLCILCLDSGHQTLATALEIHSCGHPKHNRPLRDLYRWARRVADLEAQ